MTRGRSSQSSPATTVLTINTSPSTTMTSSRTSVYRRAFFSYNYIFSSCYCLSQNKYTFLTVKFFKFKAQCSQGGFTNSVVICPVSDYLPQESLKRSHALTVWARKQKLSPNIPLWVQSNYFFVIISLLKKLFKLGLAKGRGCKEKELACGEYLTNGANPSTF